MSCLDKVSYDGDKKPTVDNLISVTHLERGAVIAALHALKGRYLSFETPEGSSPAGWYITSVTSEARQQVGQWRTLRRSDEKRRPWWREGKTVVPIIVSVMALCVAAATFLSERSTYQSTEQANRSTALANRMADARSVSFWIEPPTATGQQITIQNVGSQAIRNVWIAIEPVTGHEGGTGLNIGIVPACATSTTSLTVADLYFFFVTMQHQKGGQSVAEGPPPSKAELVHTPPINSATATIFFTDGDQQTWILGPDGNLIRSRGVRAPFPPEPDLLTTSIHLGC